MTAMTDPHLTEYRSGWDATGRRGRLEVSRSAYDYTTVSWEVLYAESGSCQVPIAEFTTWAEAQQWATENAGTGEECLCTFAPTSTLRQNGCPVHDAVCSCWETPIESRFVWAGITEPGSALEPNPECDVHFPVTGLVGVGHDRECEHGYTTCGCAARAGVTS